VTGVIASGLRHPLGDPAAREDEDHRLRRTPDAACVAGKSRRRGTPDADYLRQMIGFAARRLMEPDIESRAGAAHGERSPERLAHRNAFRWH
jgi:hypothetical protein